MRKKLSVLLIMSWCLFNTHAMLSGATLPKKEDKHALEDGKKLLTDLNTIFDKREIRGCEEGNREDLIPELITFFHSFLGLDLLQALRDLLQEKYALLYAETTKISPVKKQEDKLGLRIFSTLSYNLDPDELKKFIKKLGPFTCSCGNLFKTRELARKHSTKCKTPWTCGCGEQFETKEELEKHEFEELELIENMKNMRIADRSKALFKKQEQALFERMHPASLPMPILTRASSSPSQFKSLNKPQSPIRVIG